jgi:thiamine biosynthesis lipoprotein
MYRYQYSQVHMGVRVTITLYAADSAKAEAAASAGFAQFAELEAIMSDYRADSELMQLCARAGQGPQRASPDLLTVIIRAQEIAEKSSGAFDITCSPLVRLWREARRSKKLPSKEALQSARQFVDFRNVLVGPGTIELKKPGMQLDLGGIAKGYACDRAIAAIKDKGIERSMCEAGGDIVACGAPPGKLGWHLAVAGAPEGFIWLKDGAVSTSGDAEQFVEIGGKRYSHIVNPHTGLGLTNRKQVSVIAKDGLTTDPLATTLCVLDEKEGRKLAEDYRATDVYVYPAKQQRRGR